MFQALLQKVLRRIFGNFIEGLDAKKLNLGIWSGKLSIQNVALKRDLFDMLGLPYDIFFSLIQKMTISVPWKSISSSPVEIVLDSLLVVVVSRHKKQWKNKGEKELQMVITDLNNFIGAFLKRLIDKQKNVAKEEQKQKGYLDNVYIRVLDNIQFSIKNIHVRYEDNIDMEYSFGITLESIQVFTSDEKGQRSYIDRTSTQKSLQVLFKTVELNNLGIYWTEHQTIFTHTYKDNNKITIFLQTNIQKKNTQTALNYLFMLNSKSLLKQRAEADLSGPRYDLNLQLEILKIQLSKSEVQQLITFLEFKAEYAERSQVEVTETMINRYIQLFRVYYMDFEYGGEGLSVAEKQQFNRLLLLLKFQQIKQIAEKQIKLQYKNKIMTKYTKRTGNSLLDASDVKQIEEYMQKLAKPPSQEVKLPKDYIYLRCTVSFRQLSLFLMNDVKKAVFSLTLLRIRLVVKASQEMQSVLFQISDLKSQGKDHKDIMWKEGTNELFKATYAKSIMNKESLNLSVSSVSALYDIRTIEQLKEFTKIKVKTSLRHRAIDKVDELRVEVGRGIQEKKGIELDISIQTPTLILIEGRKRWVLDFGSITVMKRSENIKAKINNIKAECITDSKVFTCMPRFSIDLSVRSNEITVEMDQLRINLDKIHYISLNSLLNTLATSTSKTQILEKSSKKAVVFLKKRNWRKVLATICDGYVYFWQKKDYPITSIRIKKVSEVNDINKINSILIGDGKDNHIIAFEDSKVMRQWLTDMQKMTTLNIQQQNEISAKQDTLTMKINAKIEGIVLALIDQELKQWVIAKIQNINAEAIVYSLHSLVNLSINNLELTNDKFNMFSKKSQNNLLECQIVSISEDSPQYNKINEFTKIFLRSVSINYDPALVIRLFSFFSTQSQYVVPQEKFYDEQALQKMNSQTIISEMEARVEAIHFLLINKKTGLPIAQMSIEDTLYNKKQYYYESVSEGYVSRMAISDLTNYPMTKTEAYETVIRNIWQQRKGANDKMLVFSLLSCLDGSKKLKDGKYEVFQLKINKPKLMYMHEPVLRIIDYLKVQLKGAIQTPQFFDEFHTNQSMKKELDIQNYIKNKEQTINNRILSAIGKERVRKLLGHPKQMYMHIIISQPELVILSNYDRGVTLFMSNVQIVNQFYYSSKRVVSGPVNEVLCEKYNFIFENASIKHEERLTQQEFNVNFSLDMFFKEAQYKFITNQMVVLDCSYEIKVFTTPLFFRLTRNSYIEMLKIMKLNIGHEDGLQFLMVHDYIQGDPTGISAQLDFQNITLVIVEENVEFVEFDVNFLRFSYIKHLNQQTETFVSIASIQAKFLMNGAFKQIISRRRNLKSSVSRRAIQCSVYQNSRIYEMPKRELPGHTCVTYKSTNTKHENTQKITFIDNIIVFEISFVTFLMRWVDVPVIQPHPRIYQRNTTIVSKITQQQSLSVSSSRNIISFIIPSSQTMFNVSISAVFNENSSHEQFVSVEDLQLFFCSINDISIENFTSIKRKTLISNLSIQLKRSATTDKRIISASMSKLLLRFSLKDLKVLKTLQLELNSKLQPFLLSQKQPEIDNRDLLITISNQPFEILIINDTANRYFPILYINLSTKEDVLLKIGRQSTLDINITLYLRYFNMKISVWQPIIEQTTLNIKLFHSKISVNQSNLSVCCVDGKDFVTLDISSSFLENIMKTLNDMELQWKFDEWDQVRDSMNTCVIYNYTGYPIECRYRNDPLFIAQDDKQQFKIKTDQQYFLQKSKVDIYVDVSIPIKRLMMRNVNIKSEDVEMISIVNAKKPTFLVKTVRVDISKNIKYLYLVSPLLLLNNTNFKLQLRTVYNSPSFLQPTEMKAIPFDELESPIVFCFAGQQSQPITLTDKIRKFHIGSYVFNVQHTIKEQSRRMVIESPYKLTSLLPHPLIIIFKVRDQTYTLQFPPFDPKQTTTQFYFDDIAKSMASFYVDTVDMEWSPYELFGQGAKTIRDIYGSVATIHVKKIDKIEQNSINYVIYPDMVMVNKSHEPLTYYYADKAIIPGQKLHSQNKFVICNAVNSIMIRTTGRQMITPVMKLYKDPQQLVLNLEKTIEGQPTKVTTVMNIQQHVMRLYDIQFRKYTIRIQYRLKNNTKSDLLIRHANAFMTETTKMQPQTEVNMYWFGDDYEKAIRVTINASNWQWSSPLNIDRAQLTHFILRDRSNFRKILFMTIQVTLQHSQRTVELNILEKENQFPFFIVNESEDVNIVIPSFKTTLSVGNQMYYSWDDPLKQLYQAEVILQPGRPQLTFKEKMVYLKEKKVENEILQIKTNKGILKLQIDVVTLFSQKIFRFRKYTQLFDRFQSAIKMSGRLPLCICLINNTGSKAVNLVSIYLNLSMQYRHTQDDYQKIELNCEDFQIDNNTRQFVYYPVVVKTNFNITAILKKETWLELQLTVGKIQLRLEQDFVYEMYSFLLLIQSFLPKTQKNSQFSISRVKLPKLNVQLQIQAKKLSIQSPIELEEPPQTSYPWDAFPYPIKNVALSLLGSLSISPLTFISSLHEGVISLFNESTSTRGVQGFVTRIVGSIGSSINGMVRILVGDLQRIDTFIDGVESGVAICLRTTLSTLTSFYQDPSILGFLKSVAGIVYKPITGLLQLTLKITEGIKNTARFNFQIDQFENRKRFPIVFYGNEHYYRQYDPMTAEIVLLLQQIQGGKYKDIRLYDVIYIRDAQKENSVIIVSSTHLLQILIQSKRCLYSIHLDDIIRTRLREDVASIQLELRKESQEMMQPIIKLNDLDLARQLYESIEQVMRNRRKDA